MTDLELKPEIRKRLEFVERKKPLLESKGFFSGTRIRDEVERFYDLGGFPSFSYRGIPVGGGYGNISFDESKLGTVPQDLVEIVSDYRGEEFPTEELMYERVKEVFNYPRPERHRLRLGVHIGSLITTLAGFSGAILSFSESNFGAGALWGALGAVAVHRCIKSGLDISKARSEAARMHEERNKESSDAYFSLLASAGSIDAAIRNYKKLVQKDKEI